MKICLKCKSSGPFNKNRSKKDGLSSYCQPCDRARISAAGKRKTERDRMRRLHMDDDQYDFLKRRACIDARKVGHPEWGDEIVKRYMEKLSRGASANTHSIAVDIMREVYGRPGVDSQETLEAKKAVANTVSFELVGDYAKGSVTKTEKDLIEDVLEYRETVGEKRWLSFVLAHIFELPVEHVALALQVSVSSVFKYNEHVARIIREKGFSF